MTPKQIEAAQGRICEIALQLANFDTSFHAAGSAVAAFPETVAEAYQFYQGLSDESDGTAVVTARPLEPAFGQAYLVLYDHIESRWGLVELYDANGEIQKAGCYVIGQVEWLDIAEVRSLSKKVYPPMERMSKLPQVTWVSMGPEAWESVGGRFSLLPPNPGIPNDPFHLTDIIGKKDYTAPTDEELKKLAQEINERE